MSIAPSEPPLQLTLVWLSIVAGGELTVTMPLPDILDVQPVVASVASTVYAPAAVWSPKLIAEPVPGTGDPVFTPSFLSW